MMHASSPDLTCIRVCSLDAAPPCATSGACGSGCIPTSGSVRSEGRRAREAHRESSLKSSHVGGLHRGRARRI